jgi:hypothetical protein
MAAITGAVVTGNTNATTSYVGGVIPVLTDNVIIPSGAVLTANADHVWGADVVGTLAGTDGGIVINGTLKITEAAARILTSRGTLTVGATGFLDISASGAEIPDAIKIKLIGNDAPTLTAGRHCIRVKAGGRLRMIGAFRTRNVELATTANAGDITIRVKSIAGWASGDIVVLASTSTTGTQVEERTINGAPVNNGDGTWTVTLNAVLTFAHTAGVTVNGIVLGGMVGNFTSNVTVSPSSNTFPFPFEIDVTNTTPDGGIEIRNVCFSSMGYYQWTGIASSPEFTAALGIKDQSTTGAKVILSNNTFYNHRGAALARYFGNINKFDVVDTNYYTTLGQNTFYQADQSAVNIVRNVVYKAASYATAGYGLGGCGWKFTDCVFTGATGNCFVGTPFNNDIHVNSKIHHGVTLISYSISGKITFIGGYVGVQSSVSAGTQATTMSVTLCQAEFVGTYLPDNLVFAARTGFGVESAAYLKITNQNGDVTRHSTSTRYGNLVRDNAMIYRGISSHRLEPVESNAPITRAIDFLTQSGVSNRIIGYLRYDSNLTGAVLPSATISGMGITPVTYTMTGSANQWEKFDLSVTQNSGAAGSLTLTFSAQSTAVATPPKVWLSGIPDSPYVQSVRHYGFMVDSNVARTVNPNVAANELTAIAYTGITWASNTLTITASRSPQEIYDWHEAYCAANQLASFITGSPANMVIAGALALDNAPITGSSSVIEATAYTRIGTGDTDNVVKIGAVYKAKIKIPAIVDGSRVWMKIQGGADLDSSVVSGGNGYLLRVDLTAPITINYQITKRDKVRIKGLANIGTSGASLLDVQSVDTKQQVFALAQGTDMSGSTEFSTDFANIQADVNDADDLTFTERLYLWIKYIEESDSGTRNFFGALVADDTENIMIDRSVTAFKVQNIKAGVLVWRGARLYASDGSSWIAQGAGSIEPQFGKSYAAAGVGASLAQIEASTVLAKQNLLQALSDVVNSGLVAITNQVAAIPTDPLRVGAYVAPDNAKITAINDKVQGLNNAPSAPENADAVWAKTLP